MTQYSLNPPKKIWEKKTNVVQVSCFFYTLGLGKNKIFKLFYSLGKGMSFTHKSLSMPDPGIFWVKDLLGQFRVWVPPN